MIKLEEIQKIEGMESDFSEFAKPKYLSKAPALMRKDLEELSDAWENGMKKWYIEHRVKCPDLKRYFHEESPSLDEKLTEN